LQDQEIDAEQDRLLYPCHNPSGRAPREYENQVRQIVTDYIGYQRTEEKLRKAIEELKALTAQDCLLRAHDYHELMRAHEARNIREVAEMVATAALERRESRGSYSHFRADFPHRDDANWRKMVVLKKQPDGYAVEHRAIELADRPAERTSAHINQ
jgi:succinate dehydrogenase/fumarate reductase flavoprotein subunit